MAEKRTIKAFEMLKKSTGQHEKEVGVKLASGNFKNIVFSKNCKFVKREAA